MMAPRPEPARNAPQASAEHETPAWVEDARGLIAWGIGLAVLAVVGIATAVAARQVLLLIYVSMLLATGLAPFVRWVEGWSWLPIGPRGLPRWAAILAIYVSLLLAVAAVGLLVFPTLVGQAQEFARQAPALLERLQRWLIFRGLVAERLTVGDMVKQAPVGSDAMNTLLSTVWGVFGGVLGLLTILILTFYFLVEAEAFFESFIRLVPRARRRKVRAVSREIADKVSAWLGGQLILAGVIGVVAAVGLGLLGVPYFYVLAVIAAVGELIPYLGPIVAAIPGIAIAASVSWKFAIGVACFYFLEQQLENYVILPRIMQAQVGLGPTTVLVALLLGGALLGVVGAVLAVPTAAILNVVLQAVAAGDEA